MKTTSVFTMILWLVGQLSVSAQSAHTSLRSGDAAYRAGAYEEAQLYYQKAGNLKPSFKAKFNEGNAMYQQEKFKEASEEYMSALDRTDDPLDKSAAFYNLGNALLKSGEVPRAIDAYKQSLRLNPKDMQAKTNLTRALQQQQQQQKDQQQKDKEKENDKDDHSKKNDPQQNGQQDNQNQGNQDKPSQSGNNSQNQGDPGPPQGSQSTPARPKHMTKQEAEELLRIMKDEEQKVRAKVLQGRDQRRARSDKDW